MRTSMRPVSLRRVIETAYLAEKHGAISPFIIQEMCGVSPHRAREIILEMLEMGLLQTENDLVAQTANCTKLLSSVRNGSWDSVHQVLLDYSFYREFYEIIAQEGPIAPDQILEKLKQSSLTFNQTSLEVLSDWVERVGSVQKNVFTNRYYPIKPLNGPFLPSFLEVYGSLNLKTGVALRKRYVEIPKIREYVCERMTISREAFDSAFIDVYQQNIGNIELSGAPVTTHAKTTVKRIKHIAFSEMPERITMDITSDKVLQGIVLRNKHYYYVAVHGGDLIE